MCVCSFVRGGLYDRAQLADYVHNHRTQKSPEQFSPSEAFVQLTVSACYASTSSTFTTSFFRLLAIWRVAIS